MSMAKQGAKTAVPKLRFPEFRDAPAWEWKTLTHVCDMQAGKFISASEISESPYEGSYPCYGGNGLRGYTSTFTHSGKYPLVGRQGALCGNVQYAQGDFYATEHALVSSPKIGIDVDWLCYTLDGLQLNQFATGQAQPGLSVDVLKSVPCAVPETEIEQQKIADCLTSLDEVIASQGRKVEALKAHKRGLMQQLFPREGETCSHLRFPEFRDEPEWKEKKLGDITSIVRGGSPRPIDGFLTSHPDGLNWLKIGDVDRDAMFVTKTADKVRPEALSKTRVIQAGDFILSNSMSFGRPYISAIETCIHDGWIAVTRIPDSLDRRFLYYSILSERSQAYFVDQAAGSGVQNLNKDIIKSLVLGMPAVEEQQRIADFLFSLDAQITAESHQLTALKTHKQGLMQQLFPAPAEG
ncbi:restriction endonuclease subunit S [Fulvimonas sp. R45]|uniref:restriction endonuclease subunit S n=1 Tax=Fulvimonas sp. R45 TaxID=3045937 RepID=UPI00265EB02F|nr:restriction endonuclease subunit S [Fulvimonas sp. R45]MDO1529182.1 restriction endonuclease subunit S [Fulvimonas sp. R45]